MMVVVVVVVGGVGGGVGGGVAFYGTLASVCIRILSVSGTDNGCRSRTEFKKCFRLVFVVSLEIRTFFCCRRKRLLTLPFSIRKMDL
jgi:hypothetical protein